MPIPLASVICGTIDGVSQQGIIMLCTVAFVLVSIAVNVNVVVSFDQAAETWVGHQITPFRTSLMFAVTQLASTGFVLVTTVLLGAVLAHQRSGYWLGRLALTVPGGILLNNEVLKYLFQRPRPSLQHALVELQTYSFPSGHAVAATVFYGFAAILLWSYIPSKLWRVVIGTTFVTVILMVCFSRVYLGAHYPTDVLAGFLEGVAWLSFAGMVTKSHRPVTTVTTLKMKAASTIRNAGREED